MPYRNLPRKSKKLVYFIGISGSGMQPLACFASLQGAKVSGSDSSLSAEQKSIFQKKGIQAYAETHPDKIKEYDQVIYSSAIPSQHPEKLAAQKLHETGCLELLHRMDFLNACMKECRICFAVAGTHGKSSSTAMLSWLLLQCGLDPHIILGARPLFLEQSFHLGQSGIGVYESDESDASFLKSLAKLRLILNIDKDHLEHYGSWKKLKEAFLSFCLGGEAAAINVRDTALAKLSQKKDIQKKSIFFSSFSQEKEMLSFFQKKKDKRPHCSGYFTDSQNTRQNISQNTAQNVMEVFFQAENTKKLQPLGQLQLKIPGRHFAENALGVLSLVLEAQERGFLKLPNFSPENLVKNLNSFPGIERRLERIGSCQGAWVYDDYGHHPTEIEAVLKALRGCLPKNSDDKGGLTVMFQPHRYSRTAALYSAFARALSMADKVFLLPIYAAGEKNTFAVSSAQIYTSLKNLDKSIPCRLIKEDDISKALLESKKGDIFAALGAGSISHLIRSALKKISHKELE